MKFKKNKIGYWFIQKFGGYAKCSNCGKIFQDVYDIDEYDTYCRSCGIKMEGLRVLKSTTEKCKDGEK